MVFYGAKSLCPHKSFAFFININLKQRVFRARMLRRKSGTRL